MTQETLDETIDRVARELTAVGADPAFTARVRERMHRPGRPWLLPALGAASLAGAMALAVVLMPPTGEHSRPEPSELSSRALAPVAPLAAPMPQPDLFPALFPAVAAPALVIRDESPLAIAALSIEPLPPVAAVEIAPLQVADLQISEIEYEESKEPR